MLSISNSHSFANVVTDAVIILQLDSNSEWDAHINSDDHEIAESICVRVSDSEPDDVAFAHAKPLRHGQ